MNQDDFAFFNRQLAAMVRDGIPLESALRRLCSGMSRGLLRGELEKLETDLAKGTPLREAVAARQLPDLYRQMLEVGAQSNNLPSVLTMLADHYERRHLVWTRLKGLMVYPAIVFVASFLLSCLLAVLMGRLVREVQPEIRPLIDYMDTTQSGYFSYSVALWAGPILLGLAGAIWLVVLAVPFLRAKMRWWVPAFREASLAQTASAFALMLKNGVSLDKSLSLMERLERGSPAGSEFARWHQRLASGLGNFSEMASGSKVIPPFFIWTVAQSYEDLPGGFQRAAEAYQARAAYRIETLLYAALPCSILLLGVLIVTQLIPLLLMFASFFRLFDADYY